MSRRKWVWTDKQKERANQVNEVANDLEAYWPLTLRQIYYQLVSRLQIKNTRSQYTMLSRLVKWMRIDGLLPWDAIEDRTRTVTDKRGFENLDSFIKQEMRSFLKGYTRCLIQEQDKYIEVWTEKDALLGIFEEVVYPYCIRAVVCRGYSSVTFIADFFDRAEKAIMRDQMPIILYFGDLDPSGVQMLEATRETLENEMGLEGVEYKRIGLSPEQVEYYDLPQDPTAAKPADSRYKKYVEKYGTIAVELDSIRPDLLQVLIRNAIEAEIDMDLFEDQKDQEYDDWDHLAFVRERMMDALNQVDINSV